jgi:hypothetical protein
VKHHPGCIDDPGRYIVPAEKNYLLDASGKAPGVRDGPAALDDLTCVPENASGNFNDGTVLEACDHVAEIGFAQYAIDGRQTAARLDVLRVMHGCGCYAP